MNIHRVYSPFVNYFRAKRIVLFYKTFSIDASTRLIDVGGNLFFWNLAGKAGLPLPKITIANLYQNTDELPDYANWVVADGRCLPFDRSEFDIAFCNSVIEHVGDWASQVKFASEIRRIACNYFVQTPCQRFVIEPHLITPFVHWLPMDMQRRLIRNFTVWGLAARPSIEQTENFLAELKCLDSQEMVRLFPDANIYTERFLAFPKSIIAIKKSDSLLYPLNL